MLRQKHKTNHVKLKSNYWELLKIIVSIKPYLVMSNVEVLIKTLWETAPSEETYFLKPFYALEAHRVMQQVFFFFQYSLANLMTNWAQTFTCFLFYVSFRLHKVRILVNFDNYQTCPVPFGWNFILTKTHYATNNNTRLEPTAIVSTVRSAKAVVTTRWRSLSCFIKAKNQDTFNEPDELLIQAYNFDTMRDYSLIHLEWSLMLDNYRKRHLTVSMSIDAVASSIMRIRDFLRKARAKQNNCRWPTLKFSPPSLTIESTKWKQ